MSWTFRGKGLANDYVYVSIVLDKFIAMEGQDIIVVIFL